MSGDSYVIDLTQLIQQLLQQTPTQTQTQTTTPTQTSTQTRTQTPTTTTTTQTTGHGVFYLAKGDPIYGSKAIRFLEEAYAYFKSLNLNFVPPCEGDKYPVVIEDIEFGADVNVGWCVERIRIDVGLSDFSLRSLAYHELAHIVRFAMIRDVNGTYSWFSEAIPEAVAYSVVKMCSFAIEYFTKRLWKVNPYHASQEDWYRYSAAFLWHIERGVSIVDILSADQQRAERYYIEFLKDGVKRALEGGMPLCGKLLDHRDKIDD
jgi:Predicted solute binding protein